MKFLGQFIAVIPLVAYGGLYVTEIPFIGVESLPTSVAIPFTVLAMIGVINALNHSDGLDGLAGGGIAALSGGNHFACVSFWCVHHYVNFRGYNWRSARFFAL